MQSNSGGAKPPVHCPVTGGKSDVTVVPMPGPGESVDLWMRENIAQHCVFRVAGHGDHFIMGGLEARRLVNDRITDRKGHFPFFYPGETDYRMIPEITRVLDRFAHPDAAAQVRPIIAAHVERWIAEQVLDLQGACLELAWTLSWATELGEEPPVDSRGFSDVVAALGRGDGDEADRRYDALLDRIRHSCAAADRAALSEHCLLAHYLDEEAADRMTREDTVRSIAHGLVTGFAMGPIFSGMLAELGRAHATNAGSEAAWRREYLDSDDALEALVTEASRLYPRVLTQQGTLPRDRVRVIDGVEIPPGSVVMMSIYAENLALGRGFDPTRWADDPTDTRQRSAAFAGCPFNDGRRDPHTGIPCKVRCPAEPLIRSIVGEFARHVLTELAWIFQELPAEPSATDDGVMYPGGLMARVGPTARSLPRPLWPVANHRRIRPGSRVVVVGGSIGGLVAARELRARGCEVRVIEAGPEIGVGKCETLEIDGRGYDVGAHLVSMTGPIAELAAELGIAMLPSPGGHGYATFDPGAGAGAQTSRATRRISVFAGLGGAMRELAELGLDAQRHDFAGLEGLAAPPRAGHGAAAAIVDFAEPFYYGAGYGMRELSAGYLLRFAHAVLQRGDGVGGTPAGGFGRFLRALADGLELSCGVAVTGVDRSGDEVEVELSSGERIRCDELFVACPRAWKFLRDGVDPHETTLLQQVRYFPYMTVVVRAEGLARDGLCVAERRGTGPISAYIYFHPDTDVLTCWGYAAEGQSDGEYFEATVRELEAMGARFPAPPEPLFVRRWDYFPHVAPGDFAAGFYTKLAAQQGRNHTWFGGGLSSFELTDCITAWTRELVARVCREPDPAYARPRTSQPRLPARGDDVAACALWLEDLERLFPTIVHGFRNHAEAVPEREMFVALEKGRHAWTFAQMWRRASGIAAELRDHGLARGDRALVMYTPDSIHFPAAFWGCLLAGVVAVPIAPPRPMAGDVEGFDRLNRIVDDCAARAILTDTTYYAIARIDAPLQAVKRVLSRGRGPTTSWPANIEWIRTDQAPRSAPAPATLPDPDDLAYVQYTSGSTRAPRGVYITHRMVMQNCLMATRDTAQLPGSRCLSWLPWWHDLMVVTGACIPAIIGNTMIFFSAMKWLADPTYWFEAIAAERAVATAAPNFGLELMARKADMDRLRDVELGDLVIYSGGETCRHGTFARFFARFGPLGFRADNLRNIMGMAECTLYMSGGAVGDSPFTAFDRDLLREHNLARPVPPDHGAAQVLISCGRAISPENRTSMIVVDPDTREVSPGGAVGELWITGPSVATRYVTQEPEDVETFEVSTVPESRSRFLRTGDMAFIHAGRVYICGRRKELIIVGGRNIVPMDIEDAAGAADPEIRTGCVAAFAVNNAADATEGIAVVAELRDRPGRRQHDPPALAAVRAAIRQAVGRVADADCRYVALVRPRTLAKTTSGKLERLKIRRAFEQGTLALLEPVDEVAEPVRRASAEPSPGPARVRGPATSAQAETWITAAICEQLRLAPGDLARDASFADFGVDSMTAVRILTRIEQLSGVSLSPADIFNAPTVAALAPVLSARSLSEALAHGAGGESFVVLNGPGDDRPLEPATTLFCLPPAGGSVFPYVRLAAALPQLSFVVFENRSARERVGFASVAASMSETIRRLAPTGPWNLCCYSLGGSFGAAVAAALRDCNLLLIDAVAPAPATDAVAGSKRRALDLAAATDTGMRLVAATGVIVIADEDAEARLRRQIHWDLLSAAQFFADRLAPLSRRNDGSWQGTHTVQLRAADDEAEIRDTIIDRDAYDSPSMGWERLCERVICRSIPGGHFSVLDEDHVDSTARALSEELALSPYSAIPLDTASAAE